MKRYLSTVVIIGVVVATGVSGWAADSDGPSPIHIILHPAGVPHPALRYQLLPPLLERRPGNAAVQYLKVPHEQTHLFSDQGFWDTLENWSEMPLPELRKEVGKKYSFITGHPSFVAFLERGARCESCDWEIPIRDHEFYSILLPDVQSSRASARILSVRARLQVADGKYDDAIHTLQTGFALGRHVSQGPTLINGLVGATIADMMSNQVETFIQQPDAPNLYWALASLPRPLIDFRPGYEAEFAEIYLSYPDLQDLDKKDYTPDEWRRILQKRVADLSKFFGEMRGSQQTQLAAVAWILERYPRAKRYMIAQGRSAADVEAMSVPQVILTYTMQTYDEARDDFFKWFSLPYPEARNGMEQADRRLKESVAAGRDNPIAAVLLPALQSCKKAETRASQKVAALAVLEAIRLYAADHDGGLPESLKDITEVPVPLDPFRGEPFFYARSGNSAKLDSPFPDHEPLRYQIELALEGAKP